MKKIFTMALAAIAALSMSAQTYKIEMHVWVDGTVEYAKDLSKVDSITFVKKIVDPETPETPTNPNFTPKAFTVNAAGKQVYFSQGNLQAAYDGSKWNWFFAINQWDYVGNATANTSITGNGIVSVNDTVDIFGWSTKANYYGITKSTDFSDYSGEFKDWGATIGAGWYTLNTDEWVYLFCGRTDAKKLFGMGSVNGVNGTILLPDDWAGEKFSDTANGLADQGSYYYNKNGTNYSFHTYTAKQWSVMEANGAVFLPAAGDRYGTVMYNVGSYGYYWSSTPNGKEEAYDVFFCSDLLVPQGYGDRGLRSYGLSVRLVKNVE